MVVTIDGLAAEPVRWTVGEDLQNGSFAHIEDSTLHELRECP